MKATTALLSLSLTLPIFGQAPVYTVPEGYTKVTVAAAASASEPTLTAISVTLLNDLEHSSSVTINADYNGGASTQTLTVPGITTWTANEWINHLAYVADENGAEEAFLITANTTNGGLTLSTTFDLLGDKDPTAAVVPRFPSATTVKIRDANTIGGIFASNIGDFVSDDRVFVWGSGGWQTYLKNGFGNWALASNPFGNENAAVIFPDEGMFVLRSALSEIELTLFGEVPATPQIATLTKTSLLSTRVPIDTTLGALGVEDSSWTGDDRLFVWNQGTSSWDGYLINGFGNWAPTSNTFGNSNSLPIGANSAIFVTREVTLSGEEGLVSAPLPYDPFAE